MRTNMRQVKFVMSSAIIMNKVACAPVERQAFRRRAIMKQCVSDCVSIVYRLLSALLLVLVLDVDGEGAPIHIHLLAYFASCSLPNNSTRLMGGGSMAIRWLVFLDL